jgi:hypothetical protein
LPNGRNTSMHATTTSHGDTRRRLQWRVRQYKSTFLGQDPISSFKFALYLSTYRQRSHVSGEYPEFGCVHLTDKCTNEYYKFGVFTKNRSVVRTRHTTEPVVQNMFHSVGNYYFDSCVQRQMFHNRSRTGQQDVLGSPVRRLASSLLCTCSY